MLRRGFVLALIAFQLIGCSTIGGAACSVIERLARECQSEVPVP